VSEADHLGELTCDEVREMAGAFVLGALEPGEEAAVRAHLARCDDAHAEIAELGGMLPVLAESVPIVEPPDPDALKARIMAAAAADLATRGTVVATAAIAATSAAPSTAVAAAPPTMAVEPTQGQAAAPPTMAAAPSTAVAAAPPTMAVEPTPFPTADERAARHSRVSRGGWILRIAAVLAVLALGGWNLLLQNQLNAATAYQQSVTTVLDVAAQPGSHTAILTAAAGGSGSGLAAISAAGDVTLAMQDLAPTTGARVYTAWVIAGDAAPVSLGSFTVGSSGTASFDASGAPSQPGVVLALTLEPGPGAQTPTLPIISKGAATAAG
jgi:Anti-sigma-K factor rskA, C-terminal/Putative zinc-finger